MKLADLPQEVIADLCQDHWRLDIDPVDSKHEFWMAWRHFVVLPENLSPHYEATTDDLADFLNFDGFDVLLPVARSHHPDIKLIRLIHSPDQQSLTLFLHDSDRKSWFQDDWGARYGFLAVADKYQKFGCSFYLANYYHFSCLLNEDYETAKKMITESI